MNDYEYVYTKLRKEFGQPCRFAETAPTVLAQIKSDGSISDQMIRRNPATFIFDTNPEMSVHSVNTERVIVESRGHSHLEGGWPKEVDPCEPQDTAKWRKRLDKDPLFVNSMSSLCKDINSHIKSNNTINMYDEYNKADPHPADDSDCDELITSIAVFKDPTGDSRTVSRVCWHPDGPSRFIASYSSTKFQKIGENFHQSSFIWEIEKPNWPIIEIFSPTPHSITSYYPRNPDLIIAGGTSGSVLFYDLRQSGRPVLESPWSVSHSESVTDISWLQSKTHSEFVSTSTDGRVVWWDTRNLSNPVDECLLPVGATSIDWQIEAGPTKFLVGCEDGSSLLLNRKPKKPVEVGGWFGYEDRGGGGKHFGPISSIRRNSQFPKYFLTFADWTVKLWLEDLRSPLYQTAPVPAMITCGGWSPVRPALFFSARQDGVIDFYDFFFRMTGTYYSYKMSDTPVSAVGMHGGGELMLVGDAKGEVSLLKLSNEFHQSSQNEKNWSNCQFEKEQKREKNLDYLKKQKLINTNSDQSVAPPKRIDETSYITREKEWAHEIGDSIGHDELTIKIKHDENHQPAN
jgi:dynein intermediate chain 2